MMPTHDDVRAALIGRKITAVGLSSYLGWSSVVEEIHLDDGTVVELGGNADVAYVDAIIEGFDDGTSVKETV